MKKKWIILSVVLVVVVAMVLIMTLGGQKKQTLHTVEVKKGDIADTVQIAGQIIPHHVVQVKSQLSGQVERLLVKPGQMVKKGEKLAVIKPTPTPSDIAQAKSAVDQAHATLVQAQAHYKRYKKLVQTGAVTQSDLDEALKADNVAQAQYSLAQQQLALILQGKTTIAGREIQNVIVSPVDGQILSKAVEVGDSVVPVTPYQAGTPLFTIANMNDLIFKGDVSQIDVGKLKVHAPAEVSVAAMPQVLLKGGIRDIALQVSSANDAVLSQSSANLFASQSEVQNGFSVKIGGFTLPKENKQIFRAGYQATARVIIQQLKNVLLIPQVALHFDEQGAYVELLPPDAEQPQKQPVTLGVSNNADVQVIKGLNAGEKVVVDA